MAFEPLKKPEHDSKNYEYITFEHNVQKEEILTAFNIVRDYIIEKQLVLTGGMCIHMALLAAGKPGIYDANAIPDYDVFSPDPVADSQEIAVRLCKAKLPQIGIVAARHVTTLRVRTNFVWVADITYIPQAIIDKIPMITYEGFRIEHPLFKFINMHKALSRLLEDPPMEAILQRFRKDCKRFDALYAAYPPTLSKTYVRPEIKSVVLPPEAKDKSLALWGALAYYTTWGAARGYTPRMPVDFTTNGFSAPMQRVDFYDKEFVFDAIPEERTYYNAWIEFEQTAVIVRDGVTITFIDNTKGLIAALPIAGMWIMHPQNVMMHMLVNYFRYGDETYLDGYLCMHDFVLWASELVRKDYVKPDEKKEWDIGDVVLTGYVYGKKSLSKATIRRRREIALRVLGQPPEMVVPRNVSTIGADCVIKTPKFEIANSPLWQIDGEKIKEPVQYS
jgi:hypothetical protein